MKREKSFPSLLKKHRWRVSGPYLLLVWKTWKRAELILCLNIFSLLHTYKCITRNLLLVVFTILHQLYIKDKENWQDVKRRAAYEQVSLWIVSMHNEYMIQILLKTKLTVHNGTQRNRWSSWHDIIVGNRRNMYIYLFSGISMYFT